MKTTARFQRALAATIPAATAFLLVACGGDKQMHAATPAEPMGSPATSLGAANTQPPEPPNTATASNISISQDVLTACNIASEDAFFAFDSARLTTFDRGPLDQIATCFTSGPMEGRKLQLVGHADPRGTAEYNVTLGQSRADAVAGYLGSRGLNQASVTTTSRGALDATGRDETGWAHDRRVDVTLAN